MDNEKRLLLEISKLSARIKQTNESTGGFFNIFDITSVSHDEVTICRVIYELLNPKGSHCQKGKYLKMFCEKVLGLDFSLDICNKATVYREYVISENRRIDLYILIADNKIPIEVKIYAGDQKNQLCDYYNFTKNKVYYLTLYGSKPSKESCGDLVDEYGCERVSFYECVSFKENIINWLNECLADEVTSKLSPIKEILLQFEVIVRKLTGQPKESEMMEIKELLINSKENMESAYKIESVFKSAKTDVMIRLFEDIKATIHKKTNNNPIEEEYLDYSDCCKEYYNTNHTKPEKCPGLNYLWKDTKKDNVKIWLRIEIFHRLYVGLYIATDGKDKGRSLDGSEIKRLLGDLEEDSSRSDWRIYWRYLNDEGNDTRRSNDNTPNFRELNQAFYDLCDEHKRKEFVDKAVEIIINLMEKAHEK